jgi:hypothetical protein
MVGMHFYNVPKGKESLAAAFGVKQTKSGKWAKIKYDTSGSTHDSQRRRADAHLGKGTYWEPKKVTESAHEDLDEARTPVDDNVPFVTNEASKSIRNIKKIAAKHIRNLKDKQ